jgi:hypothetical protein
LILVLAHGCLTRGGSILGEAVNSAWMSGVAAMRSGFCFRVSLKSGIARPRILAHSIAGEFGPIAKNLYVWPIRIWLWLARISQVNYGDAPSAIEQLE